MIEPFLFSENNLPARVTPDWLLPFYRKEGDDSLETLDLTAFSNALLKDSIEALKMQIISKEEYALLSKSKLYALCMFHVHPKSVCCFKKPMGRQEQRIWDERWLVSGKDQKDLNWNAVVVPGAGGKTAGHNAIGSKQITVKDILFEEELTLITSEPSLQPELEAVLKKIF